VEFEDVRINFPDWEALKPKTPFGQLPYMNIDDAEPVAQSAAMLRYAGKLGKLYPDDLTEALKVDEIIGLQEDLSAKLGTTIYLSMRPAEFGYPADWPEEEKKSTIQKLREKMCEDDGTLCSMLKMFEGKLSASGTGFFVGESPTIADCAFLPVVRQLRSGRLDYIPKNIVDKYPKIVEFEGKMNALPAVKAYYAA